MLSSLNFYKFSHPHHNPSYSVYEILTFSIKNYFLGSRGRKFVHFYVYIFNAKKINYVRWWRGWECVTIPSGSKLRSTEKNDNENFLCALMNLFKIIIIKRLFSSPLAYTKRISWVSMGRKLWGTKLKSETTLMSAFNEAFYGFIAVLLQRTFSITKDLRFSPFASRNNSKIEKFTASSDIISCFSQMTLLHRRFSSLILWRQIVIKENKYSLPYELHHFWTYVIPCKSESHIRVCT